MEEARLELKFQDYWKKYINDQIPNEVYDMVLMVFKDAYRSGFADGHADATTIRMKDE